MDCEKMCVSGRRRIVQDQADRAGIAQFLGVLDIISPSPGISPSPEDPRRGKAHRGR